MDTDKNILRKGNLLVSKPSVIGDPSFGRSVILLTEHNQTTGSVGFIMNRPLEYNLEKDVDTKVVAFTLFEGGPVDEENLYFIHTVPQLMPDSIAIGNGLYWGGNFDQAMGLLGADLIHKDEIRFFLGYSGWDEDQLEAECLMDTWSVVQNNFGKEILKRDPDTLWRKAMIDLGGESILWANSPENPSHN